MSHNFAYSYPTFENLSQVFSYARTKMKKAQKVIPKRWQGLNVSGKPEYTMMETLMIGFAFSMPPSIEQAQSEIVPNLPWAEDHFQERLNGPSNPGVTYASWPFYPHGSVEDKILRAGGVFSHSYQERYWPRIMLEREVYSDFRPKGLRHNYGDLRDLINLLVEEPDTRQAYLPVFFPEDTGAIHKGRIPCSLGYHFIMRENLLHCYYSLRSCDYHRHFRDDLYLTVRLAQFVLESCKAKNPGDWSSVSLGYLTFHASSLHCFINDYRLLFSGDQDE